MLNDNQESYFPINSFMGNDYLIEIVKFIPIIPIISSLDALVSIIECSYLFLLSCKNMAAIFLMLFF